MKKIIYKLFSNIPVPRIFITGFIALYSSMNFIFLGINYSRLYMIIIGIITFLTELLLCIIMLKLSKK